MRRTSLAMVFVIERGDCWLVWCQVMILIQIKQQQATALGEFFIFCCDWNSLHRASTTANCGLKCVCVCVSGLQLQMGYTLMHEIPISSPPILMTSLPYPRTQQYYSSSAPHQEGAVSHEKVPMSPQYLGYGTPWQLLVGRSTTQAPTPSLSTGIKEGRQTCVCPPSSTRDSIEEWGNSEASQLGDQ